MTTIRTFADYATRLREFMTLSLAVLPSAVGLGGVPDSRSARPEAKAGDDRAFTELAVALFALQFEVVSVYRDLCRARGRTPSTVADWQEIPAMPTTAFKEYEVTSLAAGEWTAVFHSSGTTEQRPSRHYHDASSLGVYAASLWPWFQRHLLPEGAGLDVICLAPPASSAPHSSLAHMFEVVGRRCGAGRIILVGGATEGVWEVDLELARAELARAAALGRAVMLLGTAFSFVHLLDGLERAGVRYALPAGSRVMETGGYKGRSRSLPKVELHRWISDRLGVSASHIVCEYGMSELSSQAYDRVCGEGSGPQGPSTAAAPVGGRVGRVFRFPPWARGQVLSPETGREVAEGEAGMVRVFDLANVRSVLGVQTEDLAVRRGTGFELIGRAARVEPRGCSWMNV